MKANRNAVVLFLTLSLCCLIPAVMGASTGGIPFSGMSEMITAPSGKDLLPITDVSDTSSATTGTTKKVQWYRLRMRSYVNATTGTQSVTIEDSGTVFSNAGAAADVTFAFDFACNAESVGWNGLFRVIGTSHEFWIQPDSTDTLAPIADNAGDKIEGPKSLGSVVYVECVDMGGNSHDWIVNDDGRWEDEDAD